MSELNSPSGDLESQTQNTTVGHQQEQQQQQQQQLTQAQSEDIGTSMESSSAGSLDGPAVAADSDILDLRNIIKLVWGSTVGEDVFNRWSQGFEFSDVEPSALVQKQGGPCAVIAPVQAFLIKRIIVEMPGVQLSTLDVQKCHSLLIEALCNILKNCNTPRIKIVTLQRQRPTKERRQTPPTDPEKAIEADENMIDDSAGATNADVGDGGGVVDINNITTITTTATKTTTTTIITTNTNTTSTTNASMNVQDPLEDRINLKLNSDEFHERLNTLHFAHIEDVARHYTENYSQLSDNYGVLLFMYSVFLTKGIDQVTADISDTSEPLIHSTYGYGAQSLINLMLTGRAVAHVWDNEQDVGGLKLRGISEQSDIGFITLMEQMRYCTVGSFFKNPRYPVWVMGSDTHLTVLFSNEKRLASPETPAESGRRIFKSYDPDGNNFISSSLLGDVMVSLNLFSDPEYVRLMQKRLDPENLGIILLNGFIEEFFPRERQTTPDTFELMHYNGIPGSNENNKVQYYRGSAILLEGDLKSICTSYTLVTCLQTKWPNIEVNWHGDHMPSLN